VPSPGAAPWFAAWGHAAYNPQPCRPGALTRRCPSGFKLES
jgi:hypothetical protein